MLALVAGDPAHAGAADTLTGVETAAHDGTPAGETLETRQFIDALVRSLSAAPTAPTPISLATAIRTAVANNPGVQAGGRERELARQQILAQLGAFDPRFNSDLSFSNEHVLTSNVLEQSGGLPQRLGTLDRERFVWDFSVSKLFQYGTEFEADFSNDRRISSSQFQALNPVFEPTFGIAVSQPLFRDFAGLDARTNVLVSRNNSKRAVSDFQAQLSNFAARVVVAYWNRVLFAALVDVRRYSLELAEALVDDTSARVKIGTRPKVANTEARANAAARQEELITATNDLDLASRTLQYTVMLGIDQTGPVPVIPADQHHPAPQPLSREHSLATALDHRPEMRSARLGVDSAVLDIRRSRRLMLPGLDFVMDWELQGLSGVPDPEGVSSETDSYGLALDRLSSGDFHRFFVGFRVDVPFTNTQARSRLAQAEIEKRRQLEQLQRIASDIALEVEDAVGDVASALERVGAAALSRELAEENLRDQQKRYDVGRVTTTDILVFQEILRNAMATQALAVTDHAIAVAQLKRAEGSLLAEYAINVGFEDAPDAPWWTQF